jgi:hypothetical protein
MASLFIKMLKLIFHTHICVCVCVYIYEALQTGNSYFHKQYFLPK